MSNEYIELGTAPIDEKCVQIGDPNYYEKATIECTRFIALIRKKFGDEPIGARLRIKSNSHDFGEYYEVVCNYSNDEAEQYALSIENNTPSKWE